MNIPETQQKFGRQNIQATILLAISFFLLALSTTISNLWFLSLIGFIPFFFAINKFRLKEALVGSFIFGFAYFLIVIYPLTTINTWSWTLSTGFFAENTQLVYWLIAFLLAIFCSLISFLPFTLIYLKSLKKIPIISIFILPIIWEFLEILRVKAIFGLEWGTLGHPLGENLFFARTTALGGVFILSSLVIFVNYALFLALKAWLDRNKPGFSAKKLIYPILILFFALFFIFINNKYVSNPGSDAKISVAIVSPVQKTIDLTTQIGADQIFDLLTKAASSSPNLVVLPENSLPFLIIDEATLQPITYKTSDFSKKNFDKLLQISKKRPETSFILGFHTSNGDKQHNSALVLEAGKIVSIYSKQDLLPFTERSYAFLESVHIEPLNPGTGKTSLQTKYGQIEPLICSEVLISRTETEKNRSNSFALVNLSNDDIFNSQKVAQHNKISTRLSAIVNHKPIIRSSKGGFSGIFDQSGKEILPTKTQREEAGEILFINFGYPRNSL